jgi:PAS domain S-box-containing protein
MTFLNTYRDTLLRSIFDGASEPICALDNQLCFLASNARHREEFECIFGVTPQLGVSITEMLAHVPDEQERAVELWQRALDGEEFSVITEVGEPGRIRRMYELSFHKMCEGSHQIGAIQFGRDITSELAVAEAKRQSEERFRQLADAMPQLVWSADASGNVDYFNERAAAYEGIERGASQSWRWSPTIHPEDRSATVEAWSSAVDCGHAYEIEHRVQLADGNFRWHLSRGVPVRDAQGKVVRWYGTATDIEQTKRAAIELREADHRKNEFLAVLGHELRNPLAAIANGIRVVERGGQAGRDALPMVQRHVAQMSRLLDDLLDISRITCGKLHVERQVRSLRPIVAAAVNAVRPRIAHFGHNLEVEPIPDVAVNADGTRLEQVISNLLDNAATYTPPGGQIRLWVELQEETVRVHLRDNGKGIEVGELQNIFEPFSQSHGDHGDKGGRGLGIGLALVQQLVELHDGAVSVNSEGLGHGSEFVVELPRAPDELVEEGDHPCQIAPRLDHLRVLAIDDNADAGYFMALLLADAGCEVKTATTGRAGLRLADEEKFDVILLDIGLPDMNGREVVRQLRAKPEYADTRIVAVSGYNQAHDVTASKEAGFDAHLGKPVSPETLRAIISGDEPRPTTIRRHLSPGSVEVTSPERLDRTTLLALLRQLAHDLRTPLSSVEYSGAILAHHNDDEQASNIGERLLRATRSITSIVDRALEFAEGDHKSEAASTVTGEINR